ncbi:hypothetical protein BKA69DRAFT_1033297, partial [Paraphysoderma sedebokerense]
EGEPSTTAIFVANLPFSLTDETLQSVFTDKGYKVSQAYVVRGGYNNRSKGFGFVDFEANEDQKRAVEEMNDFEVEERKIIVKVAMNMPEEEGEEEEEEAKQE